MALTLRLPPVRRFVLSADELVREALFDGLRRDSAEAMRRATSGLDSGT
jgi:hypothetical protein